jgi:hypothetical protein
MVDKTKHRKELYLVLIYLLANKVQIRLKILLPDKNLLLLRFAPLNKFFE